MADNNTKRAIFLLVGTVALSSYVSSGGALLLGLATALVVGNPFIDRTKKLTTPLIGIAITGLGASMDLNVVASAGAQGLVYTLVGITLTMALGLVLGRWLAVPREASLLITVGTSICGGSAIAAVSAAIKAKNEDTSIALITVLLLNTIALLIFPLIGHGLLMDQTNFGLWSALAIHDTSSVVGAAVQYGQGATEVAIPVKLARALWIVPVVLFVKFFLVKEKGGVIKATLPWFIPGFLITAALVTWIPALAEPGAWIAALGKKILILALFFIGAGLTRASLNSVGARPFIQGLILWIAVSTVTLLALAQGLIRWKT